MAGGNIVWSPEKVREEYAAMMQDEEDQRNAARIPFDDEDGPVFPLPPINQNHPLSRGLVTWLRWPPLQADEPVIVDALPEI